MRKRSIFWILLTFRSTRTDSAILGLLVEHCVAESVDNVGQDELVEAKEDLRRQN